MIGVHSCLFQGTWLEVWMKVQFCSDVNGLVNRPIDRASRCINGNDSLYCVALRFGSAEVYQNSNAPNNQHGTFRFYFTERFRCEPSVIGLNVPYLQRPV